MPSRDYILRLIEQVGQFLRRAIHQREQNAPQEVLQSVMAGFERLFGMEAVQIFQFTPDQHVVMLSGAETPEEARDKIILYAALTAEAGRAYVTLGQPKLAQQAFLSALRTTLKARRDYGGEALPEFTPDVNDLLSRLGDTVLDADTTELLASAGLPVRAKTY